MLLALFLCCLHTLCFAASYILYLIFSNASFKRFVSKLNAELHLLILSEFVLTEEDLNLFGTDALNYQFALSHNTAIPEETVADVTGKNLHGVSRSSKDFKEDKLRIPDRKPKVASLSSIAESRPEKSC